MWRAQVALFILTTETVEGETVQNIEGIFIGSGAISLTYSVGRTLYVGRSLCHSHMVTINLLIVIKKFSTVGTSSRHHPGDASTASSASLLILYCNIMGPLQLTWQSQTTVKSQMCNVFDGGRIQRCVVVMQPTLRNRRKSHLVTPFQHIFTGLARKKNAIWGPCYSF